MPTDNKAAILKAAAPKPVPMRKVPAPPAANARAAAQTQAATVSAENPALAVSGTLTSTAGAALAQLAQTMPAPVVDPDQAIIDNTAEKQHAAITENLRRARIAKAAQAAVEAKLKAEGISLDDINLDHLANERLAEMEQHAQLQAANAKAKEMYKAKHGTDFVG